MGYTVYCINSYSTASNLPKVNDLPVDLVAQLTQEWEMSGEANCRLHVERSVGFRWIIARQTGRVQKSLEDF